MEIISYVETYGLSILVIALCIISIIGILKLCKVFNWIKSKDVKKFVYYISDIVLAFGGAAIYFAIYKISFSEYLMYAGAELGTATTLYSLYEYLGARKVFRLLLDVFKKWIKGNPESKIAKQLKSLGLNEESITKVKSVLESEKAKVEAQVIAEEKQPEIVEKPQSEVNTINI